MAGKEYSLSRESLRQCEANIYAKKTASVFLHQRFFFMSAGGLRKPRL